MSIYFYSVLCRLLRELEEEHSATAEQFQSNQCSETTHLYSNKDIHKLDYSCYSFNNLECFLFRWMCLCEQVHNKWKGGVWGVVRWRWKCKPEPLEAGTGATIGLGRRLIPPLCAVARPDYCSCLFIVWKLDWNLVSICLNHISACLFLCTTAERHRGERWALWLQEGINWFPCETSRARRGMCTQTEYGETRDIFKCTMQSFGDILYTDHLVSIISCDVLSGDNLAPVCLNQFRSALIMNSFPRKLVAQR